MADSDPRNARQSRQAQASRTFQAQEDPLAEVARMVSEENAFTSSRGERSRPIRDESFDRSSFSADLEAELLQELEASFAPRTPPRTSRAAADPPPLPEDAAEDLIRSIEEQLGEFERTAQAPLDPPGRSEAPDEDAEWTGQSAAEDVQDRSLDADAAVTEDDVEQGVSGRPSDERQDRPIIGRPPGVLVRAAGRPDRDAVPRQQHPEPRFAVEAPDETPQQSAREQRHAFARQPRRGDRLGNPTTERREAQRLGPVLSGIAAQSSGWRDRPEDDVAPPTRDSRAPGTGDQRNLLSGIGNFREGDLTQEPSGKDAPPVELAGELEARFSDPSFGDSWDDDMDEPRVAAAIPGVLPRRAQQPRDSRRSLAVVAGVLGVAVIGGAAAFALRGGDLAPSGPPPVISAPDGAVKVSPPQQTAAVTEEAVGEAVYDRVAGGASEAEERIVESGEEPEEISRIVVAAPEADADAALASAAREAGTELVMPAEAPPKEEATTGGGAAVPAGPRRVRTFVVRPDGSIAAADEVAAVRASTDRAALPEVAAPAAEAQPIRALPVATTRVNGAGEPESTAGEPDAPAPGRVAALEPQVEEAGGADVSSAPEPSAAETAPEPASPPPAGVTKPAEPDAAAQEERAPIQTGAVESTAAPATAPDDAEASEPVDLLSAAPPPEEPAPPATAGAEGGWIVQVSSQRTREEAESSWNAMRERYASVLGSLQPSIQRADLGEKGVFHRVRVGPWPSRAEAIEVCEALKAAGGSCFVAQ